MDINTTTVQIAKMKLAGLAFLAPIFAAYIEPYLAGVLGSIVYLIVRSEIEALDDLNWVSSFKVIILGWVGAWIAVNIFLNYIGLHESLCAVLSGLLGAFFYDIALTMVGNKESLIRFFTRLIKGRIIGDNNE